MLCLHRALPRGVYGSWACPLFRGHGACGLRRGWLLLVVVACRWILYLGLSAVAVCHLVRSGHEAAGELRLFGACPCC